MQFPLQLWVGGSGEAIASGRSVQRAKFWAMWNFALRINPPVMDSKSSCVILQLCWRGGEQLWMSNVKWSPWRKKNNWWQAEELLEEIELRESELGILGKCIDAESDSHAYSLQPCPFCPYFVVLFSVKILNHILPVGENHGCLVLKGAESPVL